ncbi:MAG: hypothetical protein F9K44_03940 [Hyphomicrobiaceae bacterium]|nr:MAG: hypothetical protein F9K44_03940 [Hyphomicrobiaceae bacterium]
MSTAEPSYLAELESIANAAQRAELEFRASVASEIAKRERAREFAFRRLALAHSMSSALRAAKPDADAQALQLAALKRELGWNTETEPRKKILEAWKGVSEAIAARERPRREDDGGKGPPRDVGEAFAAFEEWYRAEFKSEFLALLDHEIPEAPVVEF